MTVDLREERRLLALHALCPPDAPPDAGCDHLTRLVARTLRVPISLITLAEADRLRYWSQHGIALPETHLDGIPEGAAFCAEVARSGRALVVEDAASDPRLAADPLVAGPPGIRFYAGVPLRTAEGLYLGALCAMDTVPRSLSEDELELLTAFADAVLHELEHSRQTRVLLREAERVHLLEARFGSLVRNGSDVITLFDAAGAVLYQSPSVTRILGYAPEELLSRNLLAFIHPEDHDQARRTIQALRGGQQDATVELRFRDRQGAWRWIESTATNLLDDPAVGGIVVNARDVTEQKRQQTRLAEKQRILEMVARRAALAEILAAICRLVEGQIEAAVCSVLLAEEGRLRHGAAPSLPPAYCAAIDGLQIGPDAGACGTAAYTHQTAITVDIETDPRWAPFRRDALAHGLRACFSTPMLTNEGAVRGTFAVYYREPRAPDEAAVRLVELATYLAGIALEHARTERALRESEASLRALAETTSQIVFRLNAQGTRTLHRTNWQNYTGQPEEEAHGTGWTRMVHPEDLPRVAETWQGNVAARVPTEDTFRLRMRDGTYRWFSSRIVPVFDEHGALREWVGTLTDVHDRRQAEAALRKNEERYRIVVKQTGQILYDYDLASGRISWHGAVAETTGYDQAVFNTFDIAAWELHVHPEDRPAAVALLAAAIRERKPYDACYRFRRADGSFRYLQERGVCLLDADGRPYRMLGAMQDVSEQKQAEEALRTSERFLDAILENLPLPVFVKDARDHRYVQLNKAAEELLGYPREEFLGKTDYDFYPKEVADFYTAMDRETVARGAAVDIPEEPLHSRRQGLRIVHTRKVPVLDDAGQPRYVVGIAEDITARKQYETELLEAKEKAEEMSRLKTSFLANMSHEIRTPLTSIIGFSEVLASDFDGKGSAFVQIIHDNGTRLLETLNSVLDLAQLESQSLQLSPEALDLASLAGKTLDLFRKQAEDRGLTLRLVTPEEPVRAELDRAAVGRILSNLLSNAVKFTREGSIVVSVGRDDERAWIRVEDTGIGIGRAFLPHLFDDFRQESSGHMRSHEGSGLGLAITKRLVELLGGEITVESEKEKGSSFTVRLPRSRPAPAPPPGEG